jgi:hypothetical protein
MALITANVCSQSRLHRQQVSSHHLEERKIGQKCEGFADPQAQRLYDSILQQTDASRPFN